MKYAGEVIDLMAAYPERQFKMLELVRHVTRARALTEREKAAVRKAVGRVLAELDTAGSVAIEKPDVRGRYASYSWRTSTTS